MKKICNNLFSETPDTECYPYMSLSSSILKGHYTEEQYNNWLAAKYINCFFAVGGEVQKFNISIYDTWSDSQNRLTYQGINFFKETARELFNIPLLIKKAVVTKTYPYGQFPGKYITSKPASSLFTYMITGFNDIKKEFSLYGFFMNGDHAHYFISYDNFVNAVCDEQTDSFLIHLWRYNDNVNHSISWSIIINELEDYILSRTSHRQFGKVQRVFGLSACSALADYILNDQENANVDFGLHVKSFFEHKKIMLKRIQLFYENQILSNEIVNSSKEVSMLAERLLYLYKCNQREEASNLLRKTIEIENQYLPTVLERVKSKMS